MAHANSTTDYKEEGPRPQAAASRPSGARRRPVVDPGAPVASRPAHPLPERRTSTLDYDRYLEKSTSKFKIFSAEERRKRMRAAVVVAAVLVVVALIVVWAILSEA